MVSKDSVRLALALICLVSSSVHSEDVATSEKAEDEGSTSTTNTAEVTQSDQQAAEARGLWESDLFFLQKLTGLFGGDDDETIRKPPPRQGGGLFPELLPPQLFSQNRRQSGHINKLRPSLKPSSSKPQNAPYFQSPFGSPPHTQGKPQDSLALPTNTKNVIALHLPPPPPPPPSLKVTVPSAAPANKFPYKYVRPTPGAHPPLNLRPPVQAPSRVDSQPQVSNGKPVYVKPVQNKPVKFKKPLTSGFPDLVGSFSNTQSPSLRIPTQPTLPLVIRPQIRLPQQKIPQVPLKPKPAQNHRLQHPRPAPKPQKQHPRPPPQPQRIDIHALKPTTIQKKPIIPDFNPSPKEGSMLADAFQPIFVASPNMDHLGNDIMKPIHIASARSSPTSTEKPIPVLQNFFED